MLEIRYNDYRLTEEQVAVDDLLQTAFSRLAPLSVAREAEPRGFSAELWNELTKGAITALAVPVEIGGQGGGLLELVLAGEHIGRTLAPIPLIEHTVALRLLSQFHGQLGDDLAQAITEQGVTGKAIISIAPLYSGPKTRRLVPAGALATKVVARMNDDLVIFSRQDPPPQAPNQGSSPCAWWDPTSPEVTTTVIASGADANNAWHRGVAEWRIATASALVGLSDGAATMARDYSQERSAFGKPIASFQSISHKLVNQYMAISPTRMMARKAAWFLENEPDLRPELAAMTIMNASSVALSTCASAVHIHGGVGITLEADVSLYYQRAAAWSQLGGPSRLYLEEIAGHLDRVGADRPRLRDLHPVGASGPPVSSKSNATDVSRAGVDFSVVELTHGQNQFVQEVRSLLDAHWTPDPLAIALDHDRVPRSFAELLAERGWTRPMTSIEEGGAGLGRVEARILEVLFEEYRVPRVAPSLVVPAIERYGSRELKEMVLDDLKANRFSVCLGYSEPDCGSDLAAARTRAVQDGDDWIINGSKMWTTFAQTSDFVFLLTRTGPHDQKHRTLTMFLVPLDLPGLEIQPVWAMGGVRTNMTFYTDVRVPDLYRLGDINDGWKVMSEPLATEHGVEADPGALDDLTGIMGSMFCNTFERLTKMAFVWAQSALDPDGGEPLIEDSHVRNILAEAATALEVCRNSPGEISKPLAAEAILHHADALVDMAAPYGFLDEDAEQSAASGILSLARLHAPGASIYGGTSEIYRNNIARSSLGLPKPY